MSDPLEVVESALESRKLPKIFAAMLNSAEPDSEFKMVEDGEYFVRTLLNDPDFVEALKKAHEKGVKTKFLVGPYPPYIPYSPEKILFNLLCNAYAYGGLESVKKYFMRGATEDNKPLTEEEAYKLAKSFERDVLGTEKYLLRSKGIADRLLRRVQRYV